MLYKIVAMAGFLVSVDALKIDASGLSRRVILGNAAALAPALIAAPSFAALVKQSDGEIYKRAECVAKTPSNTIELPGCCHQPHITHPHLPCAHRPALPSPPLPLSCLRPRLTQRVQGPTTVPPNARVFGRLHAAAANRLARS